MSYYIGTLEECNAYNQKVNEAKAYKGAVTSNWAVPEHHPTDDYCAIIANASVEPDEESNLQIVESLSEDWYPPED